MGTCDAPFPRYLQKTEKDILFFDFRYLATKITRIYTLIEKYILHSTVNSPIRISNCFKQIQFLTEFKDFSIRTPFLSRLRGSRLANRAILSRQCLARRRQADTKTPITLSVGVFIVEFYRVD